jgi:hypothetical protein
LLALDVGKLEGERQRLRAADAALQGEWRNHVRSFKEALAGQGLAAIRLPEALSITWPPEHPPSIAESRGDMWVPLADLLTEARSEIFEIDREALPRVQADSAEAEGRLATALRDLDELRDASAVLQEGILREQTEIASLRERLAVLREDLREHQDLVTLNRLGSAEVGRLHGDCPVCHQQLPASLLGGASPVTTLSPEGSLTYIRQQVELFEVMERDSTRALDATQERWSAVRLNAAARRAEVRALRATLVSPNGTPSEELITRRVRLLDRIDRLVQVHERVAVLNGELTRLAEAARSVRTALRELPKDRLSEHDETKLALLERLFTEQLHQYDFGSFSDERLRISREDYLPRREEFDLQADISASDSIRVVWAYLMGLLEVAKVLPTNHPGVLVFDEPRQQSTKDVSFAALLRRAGAEKSDRQIIFATSEELDNLRQMLLAVPHSLFPIDGYVLKPLTK